MQSMMLFNFVFAFLCDFFDGALVKGIVFEAIDGDSPLIVVEPTRSIIVSNDGIDGPVDNAISFASFVSAGFFRGI